MSQINKSDSQLITSIKIPLILLVILSHCVSIRTTTPASLSLSGDNGFHMVELISRSLGYVGVSGFAIISGYLFALFPPKSYLHLLQVKSRTLILPYILWVLIAIVCVWAKNVIALQVGFAPGYSEVEIGWLRDNSLRELIFMPFNGPLWYIRELIYLMLLSPIINLLIRYLKGGLPILLGLLHLLSTPMPISSHIAFYFVVGMWISSTGRSLGESLRLPTYATFLSLVGYTFVVLFLGDKGWYDAVYSIGAALLMMSIFTWVQRLTMASSNFREGTKALAPSVFFIYASHTIVLINLYRGFGHASPLGESGWGKIIVLGLTFVLTVLSYYYCYRLCLRLFPRATAILCGGRA